MTATEKFEVRQLCSVLGRFCTGVTMATTVDATGKAWGVAANSFSSVSLDPPLILWNQALTAPSHPVFRDAERFAINILAEDQIAVLDGFRENGRSYPRVTVTDTTARLVAASWRSSTSYRLPAALPEAID